MKKKLKLVILTSSESGYAPRTIPVLCSSDELSVERVVLTRNLSPNIEKLRRRKIAKVLKIGMMGAINGIRIRKWYKDYNSPNLYEVCAEHKIEIFETEYLQSVETERLISEASADLGLSLGNGYIPVKIFSKPKFGFLNVHSEILPKYQNAQSIIWPIYYKDEYTGFTIHKIDSGIDTGDILYQEKYLIEFSEKLSDTVKQSSEIARKRVPVALKDVCENFEKYEYYSTSQQSGGKFTTPTIWQFAKMLVNNRILYHKYAKSKLSE